jgi:hypothetical protein
MNMQNQFQQNVRLECQTISENIQKLKQEDRNSYENSYKTISGGQLFKDG